MRFMRQLKTYWKLCLILSTPLLLSPLLAIDQSQKFRCLYIILIMATYWMTEVLPLPVTALIPVVGFPALGILPTNEICMMYFKHTNMVMLATIFMAIAVESSGLHKRIALFILLKVGQSPKSLLAGFIITTMFLSMWISNTASSTMMVPIAEAILSELSKAEENLPLRNNENLPNNELHKQLEDRFDSNQIEVEKEQQYLRKGLLLGIAYSSSLGGTGVLTGCLTNMVFRETIEGMFSQPTGINYATWMAINFPGMILCGIITYVWLFIICFGVGKHQKIEKWSSDKEAAVKGLILKKYEGLGDFTFNEAVVTTLFSVLLGLWFFRSPQFITGWGDLLKDYYDNSIKVNDATPAMFIVLLLFIIPKKGISYDHNPSNKTDTIESCLTWDVALRKTQWGILILLGGGFSMSAAAKASGLSLWLGEKLQVLEGLPQPVLVLLVCTLTTAMTEVCSNVATASIILPVLKDMALGIKINPLYLMVPATICSSYAFMLPVATPGNAIVYTLGKLHIKDMIIPGFVLNILCVLVVTLTINTIGVAVLDLQTFPAWALS